MNGFLDFLPQIKKVHKEPVHLDKPFEKIAQGFAEVLGTVLLLSGLDLDCARYNILGVKPWLEIYGSKQTVSLKCLEKEKTCQQNCKPSAGRGVWRV